MSFEEIPHTADIKIRVHAQTLDKLFSEAFCALMQVMYGNDRGTGCIRNVSLEASDIESLLCDFLSEVLFISEVDQLVFSKAVISLHGYCLSAVLDGEVFNPVRHSGGTEVKGISYSGLSIIRNENEYMVDILFDV
jgi:SHS2 domain-containing protein